jgi:hypothetical protein
MPAPLRAARVIMALQFVLGLVGLIFGWLGTASALGMNASGGLPLAGLMVFLTSTLALQAWLMGRLDSRMRWVRRAVLGFEALVISTDVILGALDPGLTVRSFLAVLPLPTIVIVLLLLPSSGTWFDRPHGSNSPQ